MSEGHQGATSAASPDPVLRFLHVDLDAFFAAVEERDAPELRATPVVVGGLGRRGVVAAANYPARAFGVHSAMPMSEARRRAPHATFLPPRFEAYQAASAAVMAILREVTPDVEPLSLDEAFLDVAGARRRLGTAVEIAASIRTRIRRDTQLVASVGVASTKQLAKIASDLSKPDGLLVVDPAEELAFLQRLPIRRLWGVGPATAKRLERLGIATIADLARTPRAALQQAVGVAAGAHLHDLAWNRDERRVETGRATKSVGHEETFAHDVTDPAVLEREVRRLADLVGIRLRRGSLRARTVTLKVRAPDFTTVTRSSTRRQPTDRGDDLASGALELLARVDTRAGVRLIGVSAHGLVPRAAAPGEQLRMFVDSEAASGPDAGDVDGSVADSRRSRIDAAVDSIRDRFGDEALGRAVLVGPEGLRTKRRGTMWGPDEEDA